MLKGHVTVTLRDAKTGKIQKRITGDNIVTNAVADLLSRNILGCVDYTKIYPVWSRWFKGCLVLKEPFELVNGAPDPADYFIKDDSINTVVAHAGDVSPDDIADDRSRGNPNTHVEVVSSNRVKMVWEWGPSQGNAQKISAIALTHKDTGNAGVGVNSNAFKAFQPLDVIQIGLSNFTCQMKSSENIISQFNDHYGMWFEIGEPGEYYDRHSMFETTSITLYFKKLGYHEVGLYEKPTAVTEFDEHITVDLGVGNHLYCQPSYHWDQANRKLYLFTNITGINAGGPIVTWGNTVTVYEITLAADMSSAEVTDFWDISTGRSDLAPLSADCLGSGGKYGSRPSFHGVAVQKDGNKTYYFFPCSDSVSAGGPIYNVKGYVRCGSDSSRVYFSLNDVQAQYKSAMLGKGTCPVVMPGRILNNGVGYTCSDQFGVSDTWKVLDWAFSTPHEISSYLVPIGAYSGYEAGRYIVANKMVYTTKFNLPTSVLKDASQSMTVEYEIEEV